MRWGVALNVRDDMSESLRKAEIADRGGIDNVWVTDFPAIRYAPVVAAAIAERTKSVSYTHLTLPTTPYV